MGKFGFGFGVSRRTNFAAELLDTASSVTQHGVTFTFSEDRPVGQYANGDWWVRGPVTITSISPESSTQDGTDGNGSAYTDRIVHGTMVNPGNRIDATDGLLTNNTGNGPQGWDSLNPGVGGRSPYAPARNVDPGATGNPLTVSAGSVVKFVSSLSGMPTNNRPVGLDIVVLTVAGVVPIGDAIRPGVSRSDKTSTARALQFDLSAFNSFPPTPNAPDFATALGWVDRYIEASQPDFLNNTGLKGANNHREYGRDAGNDLHRAMLCLHLSSFTNEQKRTLLSHMAAIADDVVARAEEGGSTPGLGGGSSIKKSVIAVCAAALGSNAPPTWLTWLSADNRSAWAEDKQIFTVTANEVLVARSTARTLSDYEYYMIGAVDWREQSTANGSLAGSNWNALYRDIVAFSLSPGALAVELTAGAKALWDHPEFWLYQDSVYLRRYENTPGNELLPFSLEMIEAHRPAKTAAPLPIKAQVFENTAWINFDQMLDELDTPPAASDFTVSVNGSPAGISAVNLWRQNVGLTLVSPATETDTVTIDYTPGANPLVSVDQIAVTSFSSETASWLEVVESLGPSLYDTSDFSVSLVNAEVLGPDSFRLARNADGLGQVTINGIAAGTTLRVRGIVSEYDGPAGGITGTRFRVVDGGFVQRYSVNNPHVLDAEVFINNGSIRFNSGASDFGFRIDDFHIVEV